MNLLKAVRKTTFVLGIIAATVFEPFAGTAAGQTLLRFPGDSPGVPAYARLEIPFAVHTDDWAAIIFYRLPSCIPAGPISSACIFNTSDFPSPAMRLTGRS